MESLLPVSLGVVGIGALVNLMLTLRLIRWVRATNADRLRYLQGTPELALGMKAPEFRASTLADAPVRLRDYAGIPVAFIFVSPYCSHCRSDMPMLARLAPLAMKKGGVELVIVSDSNADQTRMWLDTIRNEDGLEIDLPVLVVPSDSDFLERYNPTGGMPYFCLIDKDGYVRERSLLVQPEWSKLRRSWEGVAGLAPWMARGPVT